jgi:hypothetical protein
LGEWGRERNDTHNKEEIMFKWEKEASNFKLLNFKKNAVANTD